MFHAMMREISKGKALLLIGLASAGLLWCMGCGIPAYQGSGGGSNEIDDVQYLSQYGDWVQVPPYGDVWRPDVVADWQPFYYGHWVWTTDGWAWASYEPYGWLVYHYGSWDYQSDVGWFWIPGDTWSPAQVQWSDYGDYVGWAPLPPPGVAWGNPWETPQINVWIVVDTDRFADENVGHWRIKQPARSVIERQTVNRRPPDIRRVEQLSNRNVPVVKLRKHSVNIRPSREQPVQRERPVERQVPVQRERPAERQMPVQPVEPAQPGQQEQTLQPGQPGQSGQQVQRERPVKPAQPEQPRAETPRLKKMDLPQVEARKVKMYESDVRRDVLIPRKTEPEQHQHQQPPERQKSSDTERKQKGGD